MVILLSAIQSGSRPPKLEEVYQTLGTLHETTDGPYRLNDVDGTLEWPQRGIYIFFSSDTDPAVDPVEQWHISRIGTVGDCAGSSATLWERLRAHRGNERGRYAGGGNHRGSIFRKHVGRCLIERDGPHDKYPHWGVPHRNLPDDVDTTAVREEEHELEARVSDYIRSLPFLVIDVPGEPGPDCERAMLEKNLIALVAHARRTTPELRKSDWLGSHSPHAEIAKTGLWNIDHVNAFYSGGTISTTETYVSETSPVGVSLE
jgi:hypothetical protein